MFSYIAFLISFPSFLPSSSFFFHWHRLYVLVYLYLLIYLSLSESRMGSYATITFDKIFICKKKKMFRFITTHALGAAALSLLYGAMSFHSKQPSNAPTVMPTPTPTPKPYLFFRLKYLTGHIS